MTEEPDMRLGPCCNCETTEGVRAIVMLNRRGPVPGCGWGCAVCGLPADGAVAVLCDDCVESAEPPRFVCVGYPKEGGRLPYVKLAPDNFDHDMSKHEDAP